VKVPERTRRRIAELLGREPRGLEEVAVSSAAGEPMVIRVAPLVDDKPFPTLFWLVDPELSYRIDRAEASGLIKRLQRRVDADPQLQESMRSDNLAYMRLRERYTDQATARRLVEFGFEDVFARKGVGGIGDFTRIRCLHTWYAAHLVVPNTVGSLLDEWWSHNPDGGRETGIVLDDLGAPD
jgi:hypothetical protein